MSITDRCAVGACKNARKYPEKYVIKFKPHIAAFNTSLSLHFWKCSDPKLYPKWSFACNRKNFKFGKNNFICSNHFQYGRPTSVSPIPTLYLKGYDHESDGEAVKRKSPAKRTPMPEKLSKKRKLVHSSAVSNKQTSKPIFDFEVSIDQCHNLTTPQQTAALKNISLASSSVIATPSCQDVLSTSK